MSTLRIAAAIAAIPFISSAIHCQGLLHAPASFSPQFGELPLFSDSPWLRDNARFQQFFDATELGSSLFVATQIELRYDGPIPAVGTPGPFTVSRLTIDVGVTTREPGTVFADNLSQPLTRVFDGPHTYLPDQGSQTPAPWGGTNGAMTFTFSSPVTIDLSAGELFVVDFGIHGNGIGGQAHAILDLAPGAGIIEAGMATGYGQGCAASIGAPNATISSRGLYSDGGTYEVAAADLGATAVAALFIGDSDTSTGTGPLPLQLPGTSCSLLTNTPITVGFVTDANGAIPFGTPNSRLSIPIGSGLAGATLFHQFAALVTGANPFNVVLSDGLVIQYGSSVPRVGGFYAVINDQSATAEIATDAAELGYAMRITTL